VSVVANLVLKLGIDALRPSSLARSTELSRTVAEIANLALPLQQPYVGYGAFAHKGGQHVAAMLKHSDSYQHIDPGLVGNEPHVLVSELSGRGNILAKAREFGLELDRDDPQTRWLVQHLKELEHRGFSYEAADASFEMLLRRLQPGYVAPWTVADFTTMVRKDGGAVHAEATVKVEVGGAVYHTAASGNGPGTPSIHRVEKALIPRFPAPRAVAFTTTRSASWTVGGHCRDDAGAHRVGVKASSGGRRLAARATSSRRRSRLSSIRSSTHS
jgi:2-isopropylmalate synthase